MVGTMADGPLQRLWDAFLDRAWDEGRVIKQAPASFALAVLLSCIPISFFAWRIVDAIYNERIAVLQATIQQLSAKRPDSPAPPDHQDPDGIFQLGKQVGSVELPQVDESRSKVVFQRITGAVNFNSNREFEYRNYTLRVRNIGAETKGDFSGQRSRALVGVECEILDKK
jgi:hypothetical protein